MGAWVAKPLAEDLYAPEAHDTLLLCHGVKNDKVIFAFIACKYFLKGKKSNLEAEKWLGKQQCLSIGHKRGRQLPARPLPSRSTANGSGYSNRLHFKTFLRSQHSLDR